jgi:aryl-phospho-beta-D-glucosidase BglC (GH1 family)
MLYRSFLFALIMPALTLGQTAGPTTPTTTHATSVRQQRLAHLGHGINITGWLGQVFDPKGYTKEHFQTYITAEDIALIKSMGFDHVRLVIDPRPMFAEGHADQIPSEYLGYLDAAVKLILDDSLAVIIDMHASGEFKADLGKRDELVEEFADFWRALAHHYASLNPDLVFFEILNEPEMSDRYRWYGVEAKLAAAIRQGAPQNTIIATGAKWSADDELLFLEPITDTNVIYNFHFYEPHIFTHQGATWGVNFWHFVRELSYPSNRASAEKAAAGVPDEINQLYIRRYGMEHWDADRIDMEIGQVASWAKKRNVPVLCDEFGVYRKYADPRDRAAWLHDVRTALESRGIGWTMWEYSGGFGVVTKGKDHPTVDQLTVEALGLTRH